MWARANAGAAHWGVRALSEKETLRARVLGLYVRIRHEGWSRSQLAGRLDYSEQIYSLARSALECLGAIETDAASTVEQRIGELESSFTAIFVGLGAESLIPLGEHGRVGDRLEEWCANLSARLAAFEDVGMGLDGQFDKIAASEPGSASYEQAMEEYVRLLERFERLHDNALQEDLGLRKGNVA